MSSHLHPHNVESVWVADGEGNVIIVLPILAVEVPLRSILSTAGLGSQSISANKQIWHGACINPAQPPIPSIVQLGELVMTVWRNLHFSSSSTSAAPQKKE